MVVESCLGVFYVAVIGIFGVLVIGVSVNDRVYAGVIAGVAGYIFRPYRYGIGFPRERLVVTRVGGIGFVRAVGDCVRARKVSPAIYEAYYAAVDLA